MKVLKFRIYSKLDKSFSYLSLEDAIMMLQSGSYWRIHRQVDVEKQDIVIQQFINMLDIIGKEIYEGDIIKAGAVTGAVRYSNGAYFIDNDDCVLLMESYLLLAGNIKVIGNIFENPLDSSSE